MGDAGDIVGIVSERDYLTKVALVGRKSDTTRVAEIMTPSSKIKTVSPHHNVVDAMVLMTSHNIRHLPVVDTVVKNAKRDVESMAGYIRIVLELLPQRLNL